MSEREETRDEYLDRLEEHERDEDIRALRARIAELEARVAALCRANERLIDEGGRRDSRAEKAEAERDARTWRRPAPDEAAPTTIEMQVRIRNARIAELEKGWEKCIADGAELTLRFRLRAEKAEAERDQLKQLHRHALDSVDQVFQSCDEVPHPLLSDFCRVGEDKFRAVVRLANSYISVRAERDRYLATIREYVGIWTGGGDIPKASRALRRIAEEKP